MKLPRILLAVLVAAGLFTAAFAADKKSDDRGKAKKYPLTTCIVTENDLESMGGAVSKVYKGQEVKFCCKPCIKKFDKDPERYLQYLKEETEAAAAGAPKSSAPPKKH